jgi:hypothetical protein
MRLTLILQQLRQGGCSALPGLVAEVPSVVAHNERSCIPESLVVVNSEEGGEDEKRYQARERNTRSEGDTGNERSVELAAGCVHSCFTKAAIADVEACAGSVGSRLR